MNSRFRKWWRYRPPRIAIHASSVVVSNVVTRATTFVVYALVAHRLGAAPFGYLALATSVAHLASRFSGLGLRPVMTRQVARVPGAAIKLLSTALPGVIAVWAVGWIPLLGYLEGAGHAADARRVIMILYIGAIGYAVSQVSEGALLAHNPNLIPLISVPVWLLQTMVAWWLLVVGSVGVVEVAVTIASAQSAIGVLSIVVLARVSGGRLELVSPRATIALIRGSGDFMALGVAETLASSSSLIIVDLLTDDVAVGLFAAAQQLLTPVGLVSDATASTLYPVLVRRLGSVSDAGRLIRSLAEAVLAIVIPAAVGLFVLASPLLELVYGPVFGSASIVVRIVSLAVVCRALALLFGQALFAKDDERSSLGYALIRAVTAVGLGWVLTASLGIRGAALATALTAFVNMWLHARRVRTTIGRPLSFATGAPSVVAAAVMAIALTLLRSLDVVLLVAVGVIVYGVTLFLLYRVRPRLEMA